MRMPGASVVTAFTAISLSALMVGAAAAQDSRADAIASEQAAKATQLHPYEPSKGERIFLQLKRTFIDSPSGFYPMFGSVYSGGGFTGGGGYRQFYGDRTFWDAKGLLSIKGYKLAELSTESPGHAHGRVDLRARVGWRDATDVAFYGLGIDSGRERSAFGIEQAYLGGGLDVRPTSWTLFTAGVTYEDFKTKDSQGTFPEVSALYSPRSVPGLGTSPTYLHTTASAGIDWRPSDGYARRGGLYNLSYHNYADQDSALSFDRLDVELVQHFPIMRETWVFSVRGQVQTTIDDDDIVPYFLLPALGSGTTLRAYDTWRFRDRHSLLASAEWRWVPNMLGLDMALFYDAGKVTRQRSDLDFDGLKSDFGVGVRFHGPTVTPIRIELAKGSEGLRLVFAGSAAF